MAKKSTATAAGTALTPITDLSNIYDHPDIDAGQAAHDALDPQIRQKLTQALQQHLALPEDWHTPQQDYEADQKSEQQAIQNLSAGDPPVQPVPAKSKIGLPAKKPDFSEL